MSFHAATAALILLLFAAPVLAQPDARSLFFSLVTEGTAASESQLVVLQPRLKACGIEIQHDSTGALRGRLFLRHRPNPADPADAYAHAVDVIDYANTGNWEWVDRGGPAYEPPASCGASPSPPPSPSVDLGPLLAENTARKAEIADLHETTVRLSMLLADLRQLYADLADRITTLEARPIVRGCKATVLRIPIFGTVAPIHCEVTP